MLRTLSLRLYPSPSQEAELNEWLFLGSLLHNACIEERQIHYRNTGKSPSAYDQIRELRALKASDARFLRPLHSTLQQVILRVEKAYRRFFGAKGGYPKFTRARFYTSLGFPKRDQDFKVAEKTAWLGKLGWMRARGQRLDWLQSWKPKSSIVERRAGQWFLHVQAEVPDQEVPVHTGSAVGLDVGLTSLIATSDGELVANPKHLARAQKRLTRLRRRLTRKLRGSQNKARQALLVAQAFRRVRGARKSHLHALSRRLVERHSVIAMEASMPGLRHGQFAKGVHDASWSMLKQFIKYKAVEVGSRLVEVHPYGTSQECSGCGKTVRKALSVRVHDCGHCGLVLDRDVNAARNILARALQILQGEKQEVPRQSGELTPVEMRGFRPGRKAQPVLVREAGTTWVAA